MSGHPFFVEGKGFVLAGQLAIGNAIVTRAGPSVAVVGIERKQHPNRVYNFEVADDHTYVVGKANGGLWVHNDCTTEVTADIRKFSQYALKEDNPKSAVFKSLGYSLDDANDLQNLYVEQAKGKIAAGDFTTRPATEHGEPLSIHITIPHRNGGDPGTFVTGWIRRSDGSINLTTPFSGNAPK